MIYRVKITGSALRALKKLDQPARRRVQTAIELLAENPRPPAAKPLVNSGGSWRVRTGNYRIIYDIADDELIVMALKVGHRRDIYK